MRIQSHVFAIGIMMMGSAGCGDAPPPVEMRGPLDGLAAETGTPWRARFHADLPDSAAFLVGRTTPLTRAPDDAARAVRAFVLRHRLLFPTLASEDQLRAVRAEVDEVGMIHVRYRQQHRSLPVWRGELAAHLDREGALVAINGRFVPVDDPPAVPTYDDAAARRAALADARALFPDVDWALFEVGEPELVVYAEPGATARLAWRVETHVRDEERYAVLEQLIDAVGGGLVRRGHLESDLEGSGVGWFGDRKALGVTARAGKFWLEDGARGGLRTTTMEGRSRLPGVGLTSDVPDRWDTTARAAGAAVDVHAYVGRTFDYFLDAHGRSGWDGNGSAPRAVAHVGTRANLARWTRRYLLFGDGDGATFSPLGSALDVVAHEYTHAVIDSTAGLVSDGESGAVAEGIADLFGCFVSYGSGRGADWQVGETVYHPDGIGRPLRDLERPARSGHPAHVDERYAGGGRDAAHRNSTIVSHAAWRFIAGEGGMGVRDGARVVYRALARYLTARAGFADTAEAMALAARDLGLDEGRVRAAWADVGVAW
jgi:Zn-dependent metalloprotease